MAIEAVVERLMNRVVNDSKDWPVSPEARKLFETLDIADLHADSLLWGRDLLQRGTAGHVDLPRLLEGRVAVQVFGLVTKVPFPLKLKDNKPDGDSIAWLAWAGGWPRETRSSLLKRALYQSGRLHEMCRRSEGKLAFVGTSNELKSLLARRAAGEKAVGALLGVEGAQCLEGRIENLGALFDAGVRMMAPTHFQDNDIGGSAHGTTLGGLTELGRRWLGEMESKRMIVDLAHASPAVIDDVLKAAKRPVVFSHTGVKGTCDNERNLSDAQLKAVAQNGGLVGVAFFKWAVCGCGEESVAAAIRRGADVAGVDSVALGSDFDGAVSVPFDAAHLDRLVGALLDVRFSEEEVRKIMGGNALRFLQENLP
jgi:microsomal dipeptidase-like Zn-dependent dipeptidase